MITVRLYGLLRISSGIKSAQVDAQNVQEALDHLAKRGISPRELSGCVIFVNGNSANRKSKLTDGDTVAIMSPVAGG